MRLFGSLCLLVLAFFAHAQELKLSPRSKALLSAMQAGDTAKVGKLIDQGLGVNSVLEDGLTPLMWATNVRRAEVVRFLLKHKANPNARTKDGKTALMFAAQSFADDAAFALVQGGADPKLIDNKGNTALHYCVNWAQYDMIIIGRQDACAVLAEVLINAGADVDAEDKQGRTPLIWAAAYDHEPSVRMLIAMGANKEFKDPQGRTALTWSLRGSKLYDISKELMNAGAQVRLIDALLMRDEAKALALVSHTEGQHEVGPYGQTPLHLAAYMGSRHLVEKILPWSDPNARDDNGQTPLFSAMGARVSSGQIGYYWYEEGKPEESGPIVKLLLDHGARPNEPIRKNRSLPSSGFCGETPLVWAARFGRNEALLELLRAGAYPEGIYIKEKSYWAQRPLVAAIKGGHVEAARILLEAGANPNFGSTLKELYRNDDNLKAPTRSQSLAMAKLLLDWGARADGEREDGGPLRVAIEAQRHDIYDLLIASGARLNARGDYHDSLLIIATRVGDMEFVKRLVSQFDPFLLDRTGKTARQIAHLDGQRGIEQLLGKAEKAWLAKKRPAKKTAPRKR